MEDQGPITFPVEAIKPDGDSLSRHLGIPGSAPALDELEDLTASGLERFLELASPRGLCRESSIVEFGAVFEGEGQNEPETPLQAIFPRAEHLALFVVTLGQGLSEEISRLFKSGDFALGWMLDAIASDATERAGTLLEEEFLETLERRGDRSPATRLLRYSPGYCGWHLSGQKKIFEFLRPERIGVTLQPSFLMLPLKSMSGVIVAGPGPIHHTLPRYPFCRPCRDHSCQERIRTLSG